MSPNTAGQRFRPVIRIGKRLMDGARSKRASGVLADDARAEGFDVLAGHTHALLVTYKRDGTGVPTPVWFARDDDRVYVWTEINAFKAKRLRRDPRALLAPCGPTGAPQGPAVAARGRVLEDPQERERAATVVRSQWGFGRRLFELVSRTVTDVHYLAFEVADDDA
ncbi:PPOX class F420-dependent oxidoreductase [Patulibacter minatonensis]|uniref:PPOX class F420-dependent oxidoreductase n=1 Tax=Patulibacter minatonensis TaxID=298163 RepID=UPI000559F55B|nr:PPOX class F420-dependent oxidoreductase [Patulibacter minatonensis]